MALQFTNPKTGYKFILRKKPPQPMKTLGSKWVRALDKKARA